MLQTVFSSDNPRFSWLDLVDPGRADLEAVVQRYGLFRTAVEDCLDPEHLPKFERVGDSSFLILRAYDEKSPAGADTIQAFTRKVALFYGPEFLITIHRKDQAYLDTVKKAWSSRSLTGGESGQVLLDLLSDIVNGVIESYEAPLEAAEARLDEFEGSLFKRIEVTATIRAMYRLKRRVTLAKRLLWRTVGLVGKMAGAGERAAPVYQDLREAAEGMHFYADELLEDVENLLHMQLSLASHRTNEVMRVLTVFSAFFLPLTFLVGIYGMNFRYMPELSQTWGYPAVWGLMIALSTVIYVWFRRRGWL